MRRRLAAESLDRGDLPALRRRYRGVAGLDAATVQQHRAASAHAGAAAEPRALELQVVAQDVDERRARVCRDDARRAVDVELDGLGHARPPPRELMSRGPCLSRSGGPN